MREETEEKILAKTCEALQAAGYDASRGQNGYETLDGLHVILGETLVFFRLECKYAGHKCIVRWLGGGMRYADAAFCGAELRDYLGESQDILDHFPLIKTYEDLPVHTEQGVGLRKDGVEVFVYVDDDPWHEEALGTLLRMFPQVSLSHQRGNWSQDQRWFYKIHLAPTERTLPCDVLLPRFRDLDWVLAMGKHMTFTTPDAMEAYAAQFRGLKELYATMQRTVASLEGLATQDTQDTRGSASV